MRKLARIACLSAAALLVPHMAAAAVITPGSQLSITGFEATVPSGSSVNLATGLDFNTVSGTPSPGVPGVLSSVLGTGTFAALGNCVGTCGTIQDILSFSSFVSTPGEIVTTNGVTFDLNAPLTIDRTAGMSGAPASLVLEGTGLLHLAGFTNSLADITLSTQGSSETTFAASITAVTPVPEPTTWAMMILGFVCIGFMACRRRSAAVSVA